MIKLQKWNSLTEAERLGRKNAFKDILYYSIPICAPFIGLFIACALTSCLSPRSIFILSIPFAIIFCISSLLYFAIRKDAIQHAYDILAKTEYLSFHK